MALVSSDRSGRWRGVAVALSICLLLPALSGCSTVGYYTQAVLGQMSLMSKRRSIETVIADPSTDEMVRDKLRLAKRITAFAESSLGLPVEGSYSSYVDTGRRYVVWNVFAAPEFSVRLESFCYPIAGCVSYRGFFDEADAREFGARLAQKNNDVFVGGVAAYSTLGWFDDPILNTFVTRSDTRLAALIFHELAHKAVYVKGDTQFNEGFATAVERAALRRWLEANDEPGAYIAYLERERREQSVVELIVETRDALDRLYGEPLTEAQMRARKAELIDELRDHYRTLAEHWGDNPEYRLWMETEINNAKLGTVLTYNEWVDSFLAILAEESGDVPRFIQRIRGLAKLAPPAREDELKRAASGTGM